MAVPEVFKDGNLNAEWIKHVDRKDNLMSKIRAFYLPGPSVKPAVQCGERNCKWLVRSAEYLNPVSTKFEYNPMVFCFTCNRTYHVQCVGLEKDTLSEEAVPWLCLECRKNVLNDSAKAYFSSSKYTQTMAIRRKHFLRETVKEDADKECDTDSEFDAQDIVAFERMKISKMQADAKKNAEKNEAQEAIAECSMLKAEVKRLQETIAKLQVANHPADLSTVINESLSAFYTQNNLMVPASESTRWKAGPSSNSEAGQPTIQLNGDTSRTDQAETSVVEVLSRFTSTQERIENEKRLASIRRLSTICEFNGDPLKWLEFEQDVIRYKRVCKYDDDMVKIRVRSALKGNAFNAVKDVFDIFSLDEIINILREAFGDPLTMVKHKAKEIKAINVPAIMYREDAVLIRVTLQGYFAACTYAKTGCINSNELAENIYQQFSPEDKSRCKEMFIRKYPGKPIIVCLNTIYDFLGERLLVLDVKPEDLRDRSSKSEKKSFQVNAIGATTSSSGSDKSGFKFEIRDKSSAPYMGYDMAKVNAISESCQICNKNHFTVQCNQYKTMNEEQRVKLVNDKQLCKNCLLTCSHRCSECPLKMSCGLKMGKSGRCSKKHHATIHYACTKFASGNNSNKQQYRRSNTQYNTTAAQQKLQQASQMANTSGGNIQQQVAAANQTSAGTARNVNTHLTADAPVFHTQSPRNYSLNPYPNFTGVVQINQALINQIPRTVKMFKNKFHGINGYVVAYSVGDSGAEATLVRNDLRIALGLDGKPEPLCLQWTNNTVKEYIAIKFDLEVQGVLPHSQRIVLKDCYAIDDFDLPTRSLDMEEMRTRFPYLKDVQFESYFNEQPVILVGSPHAFAIESINGLIEGGEGLPVALETKLGVTVYGGNPSEVEVSCINVNLSAESTTEEAVSNEDLSKMLTYFNSIESLGIRARDSRYTESEAKALEIMQEEMNVLDDGTIEVPLVWDRIDKKIPKIPNNYPLAFKRQMALEQKLRKNPVHLEAYNKNVKELIELGYMRYADERDLTGSWPNVWYMPMGLVVNNNKDPPKYRNVYDASAKFEGVSLNDKLLKGPDLLIDIVKPLLKMRVNSVAFTADVQHMFHRMKICLRDQQCQRVLWRERHDEQMKTLILSSMAFGPSPSPFESQYVKNWNADRWSAEYPQAAKVIKELMYMDDVIASEPTVEAAVKVASECISICKSVNWNLISFQSNSLEFLRQLPGENVKKDLIPIMSDEEASFTTKVLGCSWDTKNDCFVFQLDKNIFIKLVTQFKHHPTKRDQASTIARIFDILGLIAHYTIRGKILLQRSWKAKVNWDDVIPEDIQYEWSKWLEEIQNIANLRIPRMFSHLNALSEAERLELHVFVDAGTDAYGCVAYFAVHSDVRLETRLIMSKAKVTPLRLQTETEVKEMPRLELLAALLGARLGDTITKNLCDLTFERYFWSDSEIVLRWILNPNQRLLKYSISPVEEILELTKRSEWRYVPSITNPADLCTKFKPIDFGDSSSVWFVGPPFLKEGRECWPKLPDKLLVDEVILASNIFLEKLNYSSQPLPPVDLPIVNDCIVDKFRPSIAAKWSKLVRAVARALKLFMDGFIPLIRHKQFHNKALRMELKKIHGSFRHLLPSDIERAEHFIFRKMQRESYAEEYRQLSRNEQIRNKEFTELTAFMDRQGLIRINSRADLNSTDYPQQFCPLLPRKNGLIPVLLMHFHEKYKHIATESQIAEVRTKCWIPKVRQAMRSVKAHCNLCRLRSAQPYDPIMGSLPEYRVNPQLRPFDVVGVDVLGPLPTVCIGRLKKIYIMIFTCTLTRFVHLHILESLESLRVLEAIVVFWAAHGPVTKFVSDNGTNFVGAAKILREDYEATKIFLKQQPAYLSPKLSEVYNVEWEFIPPGSPWFGGFYERLIREVKRSLTDTLSQRKINRIELNIAVSEAAHRMNLRPLTHNSIEADDEALLTPHELAKHKPGWPILPGLHTGKYNTADDRSVYRKGRIVADEIMRRFTAYYLPVLTKKVKWLKDKEPIKENDLVLMIEPNMTRSEWPRGRIVKVFYGKDGVARVADVEEANGKIKRRPIRKLAKIEIMKPVENL